MNYLGRPPATTTRARIFALKNRLTACAGDLGTAPRGALFFRVGRGVTRGRVALRAGVRFRPARVALARVGAAVDGCVRSRGVADRSVGRGALVRQFGAPRTCGHGRHAGIRALDARRRSSARVASLCRETGVRQADAILDAGDDARAIRAPCRRDGRAERRTPGEDRIAAVDRCTAGARRGCAAGRSRAAARRAAGSGAAARRRAPAGSGIDRPWFISRICAAAGNQERREREPSNTVDPHAATLSRLRRSCRW